MILKMDFARRNNALSRGISIDTPGEVSVNDFRPLILSILRSEKSLELLKILESLSKIQF